MNVLIAEDNFITQQVLESIVQTKGFSTQVATSCEEVVNALKSITFDLVLLDYHLDEDAPVIIQKIRALNHDNKSVSILLMSADSEAALVEKAKSLDVDGILPKPFMPEHLDSWLATKKLAPAAPTAISLSRLENLMGNNQVRINKVIQSFMDETPRNLEEMKRLHDARLLPELKTLVHKVKAGYSYLGLTDLHHKLNTLEQNLTPDDTSDYSALLTEMYDRTADVILELKKVIQS
jgi:CheY-like chemotaxis protein